MLFDVQFLIFSVSDLNYNLKVSCHLQDAVLLILHWMSANFLTDFS